MLATIADTLKDLGALCLALGGIIGFFAVVSKLRAVRWVGRRLIADPLAGWFRSLVRGEIERTNGGSTLMDRISVVEGATVASDKRLQRIERHLDIPQDDEL